MTTATDRPATDRPATDRETGDNQDFEWTGTIAAPAEAVLAALSMPDAISSWWCETSGSAAVGGALEMASRSGSTVLGVRVEPAEAGQVVWSVEEAPLTPEWVGTKMVFEVEESGAGATLHFRHQGLTAQCECFDMCQEGWTNALGRLVTFAETGRGTEDRNSFAATKRISATPQAVLAALRSPEAITSWWTPTTGSGDAGGTLEVSFFGAKERLVLQVEPALAGRVAWSVQESARTPDWVGTTIFFDVAEAGDGAMLHFRHQGLTPDLECYDMCDAGWTYYLGSLVSYVELSQIVDTGDNFASTRTVAASPDAVLAALRTVEGVSAWWGPATGAVDAGNTFEVSFLDGRQVIRMDVEPTSHRRVVWCVDSAPLTPDWEGTTIMFEVEDTGDGATIHFRHQGLTPELECYDMCHEGWTHYIASLASYVETGRGQPSREKS
jgi:uncharacterized protein YndB with AHSA1/START domain